MEPNPTSLLYQPVDEEKWYAVMKAAGMASLDEPSFQFWGLKATVRKPSSVQKPTPAEPADLNPPRCVVEDIP